MLNNSKKTYLSVNGRLVVSKITNDGSNPSICAMIDLINNKRVEDNESILPCSELFICQCNSIEHQLIFSYFPDDKEIYVTVHLRPHNFFRRIVEGIRYIFGYKCIYGHFDEFIFKKEDADRLQGVVNFLKS